MSSRSPAYSQALLYRPKILNIRRALIVPGMAPMRRVRRKPWMATSSMEKSMRSIMARKADRLIIIISIRTIPNIRSSWPAFDFLSAFMLDLFSGSGEGRPPPVADKGAGQGIIRHIRVFRKGKVFYRGCMQACPPAICGPAPAAACPGPL